MEQLIAAVRSLLRQELCKMLYVVLHSEHELDISTMSEHEFEAFIARALDKEEA